MIILESLDEDTDILFEKIHIPASFNLGNNLNCHIICCFAVFVDPVSGNSLLCFNILNVYLDFVQTVFFLLIFLPQGFKRLVSWMNFIFNFLSGSERLVCPVNHSYCVRHLSFNKRVSNFFCSVNPEFLTLGIRLLSWICHRRVFFQLIFQSVDVVCKRLYLSVKSGYLITNTVSFSRSLVKVLFVFAYYWFYIIFRGQCFSDYLPAHRAGVTLVQRTAYATQNFFTWSKQFVVSFRIKSKFLFGNLQRNFNPLFIFDSCIQIIFFIL